MMLHFSSLSKSYRTKGGDVPAVREASAAVAAGELVALAGPSGSGKTTLLLMLGLVEMPDAGSLSLAGTPLVEAGVALSDVRVHRRNSIGYIFQRPNLIPFLTAMENVLVIQTVTSAHRRDARERALRLMTWLGINRLHDRYPSQLSGGEQQRVSICRALINHPKLICADEPTASLDSARADGVLAALRRAVTEEQCAAIVSTHDGRLFGHFDRILRMEDGRLIEAGQPFPSSNPRGE